MKKCVECQTIIPVYQTYFCEECYQKLLKAKIEEDEHE